MLVSSVWRGLYAGEQRVEGLHVSEQCVEGLVCW